MACTTMLVGKKATYDGSTMIARNDDSCSGRFTPKKFVVVHPEEQPRHYKSVISHLEIELPESVGEEEGGFNTDINEWVDEVVDIPM